MQAVELVIESLEKSAESGVDFTDSVFDKFYGLCDEATALMSHSDKRIPGQMVDQTFLLLMDEQLQGDGGYFQWEIANHIDAYEVKAEMYESYLCAVRNCVREQLGSLWSDLYDQAWTNRMRSIVNEVNAAP